MVQRTTPPFPTSMSALLRNRWASEGIKLVFGGSPLWVASKNCFVCRQRCLDTYTEHQHCALAHSSHNPRRNQQGYWNFYGIDHLTACGYVARLGSCVSCERDVSLGLTRPPPTCGHSVRGERTVAGSCPANRTPLGSHVCAPGGVMISVFSSIPWLGHFG